jgi:hypothetical protein
MDWSEDEKLGNLPLLNNKIIIKIIVAKGISHAINRSTAQKAIKKRNIVNVFFIINHRLVL